MRKYTQNEVEKALDLMDLTGFDFDNDLPGGILNHDQILEMIRRTNYHTKEAIRLKSLSEQNLAKAKEIENQVGEAIRNLEEFAIKFSDEWCSED